MSEDKKKKIQAAIRNAHKIGGPVFVVPRGDYPRFELKRIRKRRS